MKSASKTKPVTEIPPFPEHARARLQAKVREVFGESTVEYKDALELQLIEARTANGNQHQKILRLQAVNRELIAALTRTVNCIDPINNPRKLLPIEEATVKQGREAIAKAKEDA